MKGLPLAFAQGSIGITLVAVMAGVRRNVVCFCVLLAPLLCFAASGGNEKGAFNSAAKAFEDGFFERAEAEFGAYAQQYSTGARLPEAILFQAQARVQLTNYAGALALLSANFANAGSWAYEYVFWMGQTFLRMGDYAKAAEQFGNVAAQYPGSPRALEAVIGEATARSRLDEWAKVTDLLLRTNGVFQAIATTNQTAELIARGYLLLGEAQLSLRDLSGTERTLQPLAKFQLPPRLGWQQHYLQCRLLLEQGQVTNALYCTTNLLVLATNSAQRAFMAESVGFYAELLEKLGRFDDALDAYQRNLAEDVPAERQRQAVARIGELSLAQNRLAKGSQMIEAFCAQAKTAAARDLALLTAGELRLHQYLAGSSARAPDTPSTNTPPATNLLQQAMTPLSAFVQEFPQSPLLGKAQLTIGWCFWLQEKLPDAQSAFRGAVDRLQPSADQAIAHFKLADTCFRLKDFSGAITNYKAVVDNLGFLPEVRTNLLEPALYQMVRAGLAAGNLDVATNGLARILESYPTGYHTDRAVLFAGQELSRLGDPVRARQIFSDFTQNAPNSPLLPEVELAIARTYEQENKWPETVEVYDAWLARFTNSTSVPRAEYCRAWANFQAGRETNAFSQFTNFIARFPSHQWTPLAQWWVADYYFRIGRLPDAEANYQVLYLSTNWPRSKLTYQARMMAGRTAVARQGWKDAITYFTNLTSDATCPEEVWLQAMFAYGDALISRDSTNKLSDLEEAASVFTRIYESYPTNQMAVLAMGQKASCLLQWAHFTTQYEPALNEFQRVLQSPLANPTTRAIARIGLAVVQEKQAQQKPTPERPPLLKAALNNYLDVLYFEKNMREGERPDLFWVKKAGLEAARLTESTGDWSQAVKVYARLKELLPPLAPTLEKKSIKAEENLARAKS